LRWINATLRPAPAAAAGGSIIPARIDRLEIPK
jgi:hypothetical protein